MAGNGTGNITKTLLSTDIIVLNSVGFVLIIPILFGNILTIVIIVKTPRLQTIANKFVMSLAMSDIIVGLAIPFYELFYFVPLLLRYKYACIFRFVLTMQPCVSSIFNLAMISVDRFIAIMYPLRYPSLMTERRSSMIIAGLWVYTSAYTSALLFWNNWVPSNGAPTCLFDDVVPTGHILFFLVGHFIIISIVIIILYVIIFKEVRRQRRQIIEQAHPHANFAASSDTKMTKTVAIVIGVFLCCWLPFFVISSAKSTMSGFRSLHFCSFLLGLTNSCMNPFIYGWRNKSFRKAYLVVLRLHNTGHSTP